MSIKKRILTDSIQKHDIEFNWLKAVNFIPDKGMLIVYDRESDDDGNLLEGVTLPQGRTIGFKFERIKIGDGITNVNTLPFVDESFIVDSTRVMHDESILSDILETYILTIDYDTLLAFDTSEIVIGATSTTSVLGQAILGQMVLA